ncbi:Homeobox protein knotted-1-like 10 [Tetrabaena socialis]|uniref:Homeobox protein knotted-1-like 10 n=1 Tax=Tetrabaena socialis TaxID=47790 RepID=A0A2J8A1T3_9CHLO|nr:Homeobox protein knotted-1-like 10 [Tetrabaena socialis]|eukprot:PNH06477.1 Homeobox protein knotted-1-like 10 [Tetrabaena socialis]
MLRLNAAGVRSRSVSDELDAARDVAVWELGEVRRQARQEGFQLEPDPAFDEFMETYISLCNAYHGELSTLFKEADGLMLDFESRLASALQRGGDGRPHKTGAAASAGFPSTSGGEFVTFGGDDVSSDAPQLRSVLLKRKYAEDMQKLQEEFSQRKKSCKLPDSATAALKDWWAANLIWPYPDDEEKRLLGGATGLNPTQIANWFINQRKRHWLKLFPGKPPENKETAEVMLRKLGIIA